MKCKIAPGKKAMLISILEFLIFWVASTFPILLGGFYLKLKGEDYFLSVYTLFVKDPVFVYTSTMIAPYFFTLLYLFFLRKIKEILISGFTFFIAIVTFAVSIILYIFNLSGEGSSHSSSVSFKDTTSLICYILACIIWFYSIYLKNKPDVNIEEEQKKRQKILDDAATRYLA